MGFTALDDSSSTATAEIAVNGMDPPELGFSPAEPTTGQSHHMQLPSHNKQDCNQGFILNFNIKNDKIVCKTKKKVLNE